LRAGAHVDAERVSAFAELLSHDSGALPPSVCVRDENGVLLLADGHHRAPAYERLPALAQAVPVLVRECPSGRSAMDDAYELALECSAKTSLPLTQAEKRAAIRRLILERMDATDREIARLVGVSHPTVGAQRRAIGASTLDPEERGAAMARAAPRSVTGDPAIATLRRAVRQIGRHAINLDELDDDTCDELAGDMINAVPEGADGEYALDLLDWLVRRARALHDSRGANPDAPVRRDPESCPRYCPGVTPSPLDDLVGADSRSVAPMWPSR
jgi:hypothetical protein